MTLRAFATPLTVASTLSITITGLCLFFGVRGSFVNPLHEVGSFLFILGAVLHIAANWKATLSHLRKPMGAALAIVFTLVSLAAMLPPRQKQENPREAMKQTMDLLLAAKPSDLAALTGRSEQELLAALAHTGCGNLNPKASLLEIARANGKSPLEVLKAILPAQGKGPGRT